MLPALGTIGVQRDQHVEFGPHGARPPSSCDGLAGAGDGAEDPNAALRLGASERDIALDLSRKLSPQSAALRELGPACGFQPGEIDRRLCALCAWHSGGGLRRTGSGLHKPRRDRLLVRKIGLDAPKFDLQFRRCCPFPAPELIGIGRRRHLGNGWSSIAARYIGEESIRIIPVEALCV